MARSERQSAAEIDLLQDMRAAPGTPCSALASGGCRFDRKAYALLAVGSAGARRGTRQAR